jgi:hypothetical protein
MKKVIENMVVYFILVFHPAILVKLARLYSEGVKMLKEANKIARQINQIHQNGSDKSGI